MPASAPRSCRRFGQLGVRVAVNDSGTSSSSLAYLRELPVDQLKVDQSFAPALDQDPSARAILVAVLALFHAMGLQAMAEGVETTT
jgi:diguanylate cyclase